MANPVTFIFEYVFPLAKSETEMSSSTFKCTFNNVGYSFSLLRSRTEQSICLKCVDGPKEKVRVRFGLFVNFNGVLKNQNLISETFTTNNDLKKSGCLWYDCFSDRVENLSIYCEIQIDESEFSFEAPKLETPMLLNMKLFESIFSDSVHGYNSDVVLLSQDGQKFRCHKCILMAMSDVFERMFESDMSESKDNLVNIKDVTGIVLKEMVRFIYTGQMGENVKQISLDLYKVAEKYNLRLLAHYCRWMMFEEVKIENAIEYLTIADQLNLKDVREKSISIINSNLSTIHHSEEFLALKELHVDLLLDILTDAAERANVHVQYDDMRK